MQEAFRDCLARLDIETARKAWATAFPHLPPMGSDRDVLVVLHYARTQAESSHVNERAYSHRWLTERNYPSGLPDRMRPRAERMFPVIADVVGVATRTRSDLAVAVRGAMNAAVLECYADGHRDPRIVKPRMMEMRAKVLRV